MIQGAQDPEPQCTCVIHNAPSIATTSMITCKLHGDPDELAPFPGQGLIYSVLISKNDDFTLIGPLNTQSGIDQAKYFAGHMGYEVHNVFSMSSLGDLLALARQQGFETEPPPRQAEPEKLPRKLVKPQIHADGCIYKEQGHPGGCYVAPITPVSGGHRPLSRDEWL